MATDYDAPRPVAFADPADDSIEELQSRRADSRSGVIDVDETELNDALELPGADLSTLTGEDVIVRVLPKQLDEFTCSSCFLVHHQSRRDLKHTRRLVCRDCA
jgi:hypothetical protein